jgi:hypothetical protein
LKKYFESFNCFLFAHATIKGKKLAQKRYENA